jgi:hypothetical protein
MQPSGSEGVSIALSQRAGTRTRPKNIPFPKGGWGAAGEGTKLVGFKPRIWGVVGPRDNQIDD